MRNSIIFYTIIILMCSFKMGSAQNWFEQDHRRVQRLANGLGGTQGYEDLRIVGDTLLDGYSAKLMQVYYKWVSVGVGSNAEGEYQRIVREQNDSIYMWKEDEYQLLYDFSLSVGDTIYYADQDLVCAEPIRFILVDTSKITLGNDELRVQHFKVYESYWDYESDKTVIETIGLVEGHFDVGKTFACHTDATWYHICSYSTDQDSMLFLQQPCYDLPLSTDDPEIKGLKLYPNPTDGVIHIESDEVIEMISIYTLDGSLLYRSVPTHSRINLNDYIYKPGMYFIELESHKGNVSKKRVYIR